MTTRISIPAASMPLTPKCILANAFSLQMLGSIGGHLIKVTEMTTEQTREVCRDLGAVSAVGHADTAAILGSLLNADVAHARVNVSLLPGDTLIVGQVTGGRLPEGATTLPEGTSIRWLKVELIVPHRKEEARDMTSAIRSAVWGYIDHHAGVDDDDELDNMRLQANSACEIINELAV